MAKRKPKAKPNVLIVDGDPYAFQAAIQNEVAVFWNSEELEEDPSLEHIATAAIDVRKATLSAKARIVALAEKLNADVVLCLSDPRGRYFRNDLGSYKENRKLTVRPLCVREIKNMLAQEFETVIYPRLEGDDVIGILMTDPKFRPNQKKISVSIDKDLKTIPGWFMNPDKMIDAVEITQEEADRWFLAQTIGGDLTDGYGGAPGFGTTTALKYLEAEVSLELYDHILTSGPRKGQIEQRKREVPGATPWETVVSCYQIAGLDEEDALRNARMARILTADLWDAENQVPILWSPDNGSL